MSVFVVGGVASRRQTFKTGHRITTKTCHVIMMIPLIVSNEYIVPPSYFVFGAATLE